MFYVSRIPMCEESQKSTKELNKRDTDATCVRNKASQGSVLEGESHLTCHSTHQNLGHKREQSKEWWRFLPGHALSFPFFSACWLGFVESDLGSHRRSSHPGSAEQHHSRNLGP